ncbi:MAG TPA: MBL fold metallo-hydrolase [Stellaceae bacterium]|nr:MBL fold metallo-hydrolase [Stellaceae bacterium]
MTAFVEAQAINGPFDDPGLYIDFRFGRRALLFDLGDLAALPARKLVRVSHVFVSHAHMDHFSGFERLLRMCLRRPAPLELFGPPGFIDRVAHKLAGYSWNLTVENEADFVIAVTEFDGRASAASAEFHSREAFLRRNTDDRPIVSGILLDETAFCVRAAVLDHGIPSLAFAFEEKSRINIWRAGLDRMGLSVGPWLDGLKEAVRRGDPEETSIPVLRADGQQCARPLGELRTQCVRVEPGRKFAYVVDAAFHAANAAAIADLARGAERLFIETMFLSEDAEIAARHRHLTAAQAGSLARLAGVGRIVPIHFSARYLDREEELRREAGAAFRGEAAVPLGSPISQSRGG